MRTLSRRHVATVADVAAGVGIAANASLVLMYAIELPRGGPYRFGAANDLLGSAQQALLIPVVATLSHDLREEPIHPALTPVTLGACAVGATSGTLLVARVLPFPISTALSIASVEVQALWVLITSRRFRARAGAARRMGEVGMRVSTMLLGGSAILGLGFGFPPRSRRQMACFVLGGVPSVLAWLGWPLWLHRAAAYLGQPDTGASDPS